METVGISIRVEKPFGNLYRPRCVLVALGTPTGEVLVGEKADFLPPGMTRLLGGGIDVDEPVEFAAIREVREETGVDIIPSQLVPLFTLQTAARDRENNSYFNETHVFFASVGDVSYSPSDDVSKIVALTITQLFELGEQYNKLQDHLWHREEGKEFRWSDYGRMYSLIHVKAAEKIQGLL